MQLAVPKSPETTYNLISYEIEFYALSILETTEQAVMLAGGRSTDAAKRRNRNKLECGPMPNVMAALPNIGGALCSMPQRLADAH